MNDATAVFWNHLSQQLATYLPQAEREKVEKGFYLAQQIHQGKFRLDGSPYITHVLSVATILANWHAPAEILIAGLLHDALKQEYSNYPDPDFLEKQTSPQILRLIEAAISLGRYGHLMPFSPIEDLSSRESAIDHLPWAMQILSNEPMAVVIKIADRLHNFQSLAALDVTRQITYAERTKRIFVPFADRLGMRKAKRELEDRAFQVLQPNLYWRCKARYPWEKREKATSSLIEQIRQRLASFGIQTEVKLHPRNLARLNQRERLQKGRKIPLHLAQPLVVIVPDVEACYRALGILHGLWLPVPGEVRDYIAAPKTNGYRSLHTLVRLPQDGQAGGQLQILIRTREMDLVADYGVMARWLGVDEAFLPELPQPVSVPKDKIIVFTPDGEPKELPRGATVIDFAYAVHDYLGHHYMGAMVNGRMVEPDLVLEDADVVKIRTSQASVGPSNEWLKFVKTRKARSAIRRWLKKQDPIATAQKGWDLLNAAFGKQGVLLSTSAITSRLEEVAIRMGYPSLQDLLIDVGFGQRNPEAVLQQLQRPLKHGEEVSLTPVTVLSVAESGLPRRFGACCRPMPPDEIVGYRNRRNVVTIHRANCSRIQNRKPLLHVEWRQEFEPNQWEIAIEAVDRIGLVRDLSTILAKEKINMSSFHADSMPDGSAKIQIGLTMLSRQPKERLLKRLQNVPGVRHVKEREVRPASTMAEGSRLAARFDNPYTLAPVSGRRFFGRVHELRDLIDNLRNGRPGEAVLLWGARRIGKTSLLQQFQRHYVKGEDFVVAFLDMQPLSGQTTLQFLYEILKSIMVSLGKEQRRAPSLSRLKKEPIGVFRHFLENAPELQGRQIVLILDEFQLLSRLREEQVRLEEINRTFRGLIQHRYNLSIVFSGGGVRKRLLAQPAASLLLEIAREQRMGCLDEGAARQLIVEPVPGVRYTDTAVTRLMELLAGHPYFLQWVCGALIQQAFRQNKSEISLNDVENLLTDWLPHQGEQHFSHLWGTDMGFFAEEQKNYKYILVMMAYMELENRWVSEQQLNECEISNIWHPKTLSLLLHDLVEMDTLINENGCYCIRVPLFAHWLRANYTLDRVKGELSA